MPHFGESRKRQKNETPTLDEYYLQRPYYGGVYPAFTLIEFSEHIYIPARFLDNLQKLRLTANNLICWSNDIISFAKELKESLEAAEGNKFQSSIIFSLMNDEKMTEEQAIKAARIKHNEEFEKFKDLKTAALAFLDKSDDPKIEKHKTNILKYITGITDWIESNLAWSKTTPRYMVQPKTKSAL